MRFTFLIALTIALVAPFARATDDNRGLSGEIEEVHGWAIVSVPGIGCHRPRSIVRHPVERPCAA